MATKTLTRRQLNRALLARQMLLKRKRVSVTRAIHAVGPLQTQEPRDGFISLWSRISDFKHQSLITAAERREVVRGTFLRATLHTASAQDYLDLRLLLQPRVSMDAKNWKEIYVGVDVPKVSRAARKVLTDAEPMTARQVGEALLEKFPDAKVEGLAHCARTSLQLAIAPGDVRWGYTRPPRFVLAEKWLDRELHAQTPLTDLVLRGLATIGPATSADLRTWSTVTGIREALEELRPQLAVFRDESGRELFDLPDAPRPRPDTPAPIRFFGEYDNFFLSHADRARVGDSKYNKYFDFQKNGRRVFAFTVDGFIAGTWSWDRKRDAASIVVRPFEKLSRADADELLGEAEALLRFLEPAAATFSVERTKP